MAGGTATIQPIAGTARPRRPAPHEDKALEVELWPSQGAAEHLMLLDLGRNDVGRVGADRHRQVTDQFFVERYSQVMHIVSNVEGR